MQITTGARALNSYLGTDRFHDLSHNGLQVRACGTVRRIGGAVDATQETIRKARQSKCDLLVVHHGVKWKGEKSPVSDARIRLARRLGVAVYASHLPLDHHPIVGNAAVLLRELGIPSTKPFGRLHGAFWGRSGRLSETVPLSGVHHRLGKNWSSNARALFFGKRNIRIVGCVTGGGSFALEEAKEKKCDLFITGELAYWMRHDAQELGMNVIALGHYHTETLGIKALLTHMHKAFALPTIFIDGVAPQ